MDYETVSIHYLKTHGRSVTNLHESLEIIELDYRPTKEDERYMYT